MNKKSYTILALSALALVVLIGGWNILRPKPCVSDGQRVCFNKASGDFAIEDKAKIAIQVPTKAYGEALLALFATKHPDRPDVLSFVVTPLNGKALPDISYINQNEAALQFASLTQVDEKLVELWINNLQWDKSNELNKDGLRFIPMSGDGFSFIYDATVLTRLKVNLNDADLDGLPDAIDTKEEIDVIAEKYLAEDKKRTFVSIFPIQFNEVLSFYPFLTFGGWHLFPQDIATQPGFETPEFLKALQTISNLGASENVKVAKIDPAKLVWQFDQVLTGNEFFFSMASDWMFVEAFEARTKHDVRNTRFPSVDGIIPSPLLNVSGFVVNNATFPSAINEVLRLIRSQEGLNLFAKTSASTLLADPSILKSIPFDTQKQKDLALAYVHSTSVPLVALEGNPSVLGFTMYRQIPILPVLKQLFLGEISAEKAQTTIVGLAEKWINDNHGYAAQKVVK